MMYQLSKSGADWLIEVTGAADTSPLSKSFKSRDAAEKWQADIASGAEDRPVLQKKGEAGVVDKIIAAVKPKRKPKRKPK
ncbi:MAG: hypothetical protein HOE83_17115 [Alphaproteobacteria bacterium]|jgi:hypothetical protein|nr:hypothetical protein [Alphaproteobacteria bacterium]